MGVGASPCLWLCVTMCASMCFTPDLACYRPCACPCPCLVAGVPACEFSGHARPHLLQKRAAAVMLLSSVPNLSAESVALEDLLLWLATYR